MTTKPATVKKKVSDPTAAERVRRYREKGRYIGVVVGKEFEPVLLQLETDKGSLKGALEEALSFYQDNHLNTPAQTKRRVKP